MSSTYPKVPEFRIGGVLDIGFILGGVWGVFLEVLRGVFMEVLRGAFMEVLGGVFLEVSGGTVLCLLYCARCSVLAAIGMSGAR